MLTDLKIFVTSDVLALVIQAVGGAIASGANTNAGSKLGSNIMLAGIFAQMGENLIPDPQPIAAVHIF